MSLTKVYLAVTNDLLIITLFGQTPIFISLYVRENLMKNMESDKKHQQATRATNTRCPAPVELPTHVQAKPVCIGVEASNNVSLRVRLPNGSQTIIKMLPEDTVSNYYNLPFQKLFVPYLVKDSLQLYFCIK